MTLPIMFTLPGRSNVRLPIRSLTCERCGTLATLADVEAGDAGITRIAGDSANGYVTYHLGACPVRVAIITRTECWEVAIVRDGQVVNDVRLFGFDEWADLDHFVRTVMDDA